MFTNNHYTAFKCTYIIIAIYSTTVVGIYYKYYVVSSSSTYISLFACELFTEQSYFTNYMNSERRSVVSFGGLNLSPFECYECN